MQRRHKKHVLTPEEKMLIVRTHADVLSDVRRRRPVRDLVHERVGFSTSTIGNVIAQWRRDKDPTFAPAAPIRRGCRPRSPAHALGNEIRELIASLRSDAKPVTATRLAAELKARHNVSVSTRTMRRVLHRQGYDFKKVSTD